MVYVCGVESSLVIVCVDQCGELTFVEFVCLGYMCCAWKKTYWEKGKEYVVDHGFLMCVLMRMGWLCLDFVCLCVVFLWWYRIFAPICVAMEIIRIQVGRVIRNQNADVGSSWIEK